MSSWLIYPSYEFASKYSGQNKKKNQHPKTSLFITNSRRALISHSFHYFSILYSNFTQLGWKISSNSVHVCVCKRVWVRLWGDIHFILRIGCCCVCTAHAINVSVSFFLFLLLLMCGDNRIDPFEVTFVNINISVVFKQYEHNVHSLSHEHTQRLTSVR